jgi:hypothetical protein
MNQIRPFLTDPMSIAEAFFGVLRYFGQGMSHALGNCAITLGIAGLVFWHLKFTAKASLTITFSHVGFISRILIAWICQGSASAQWQQVLKRDPGLLPDSVLEA